MTTKERLEEIIKWKSTSYRKISETLSSLTDSSLRVQRELSPKIYIITIRRDSSVYISPMYLDTNPDYN